MLAPHAGPQTRLEHRSWSSTASSTPTVTSSSRPTSGRTGCPRSTRTGRRSWSRTPRAATPGSPRSAATRTRSASCRRRACRTTSSAGSASPTKRRAPVATTAPSGSRTWTSTACRPRSSSRPSARSATSSATTTTTSCSPGSRRTTTSCSRSSARPTRRVSIGLAQIPSIGIDTAVDALRKAKARGAKGVLISNWPSGNDSLSRDDDPFWAAAVDEGMPGLDPHQHHQPGAARRTAQGRRGRGSTRSTTCAARPPAPRPSAA